jgi:hypothetical protein
MLMHNFLVQIQKDSWALLPGLMPPLCESQSVGSRKAVPRGAVNTEARTG